MTTLHVETSVISSFDIDRAKMEERKRSLAADADDLAPSRKRPVKDENGQAMRMEAEREKDVENFQKDAIVRQMKEYKRQKRDFEERYNDLTQKCHYHDDHLRTIDAWFAQLLDEVRLLAAQSLPTPPPSATSAPGRGEEMYGTSLLFENNAIFSQHLQARSQSIKAAISDLFGRIPSPSPDLDDLRRQLSELLAKEKEHAVELRKALDEQESLDGRLEAASYRYITAEKKLDRVKSAQVQKLERQATTSHAEVSSPSNGKKSATPVKKEDVNGELMNGLEEDVTTRREALAVAEQQKAQVLEVEAENDRLTSDLSAARTKLASLTDDDYAETALFKTIRSQYEDVIKRVNDLDATNIQLREEAQRLHAERTSYRTVIDEENRASSNEIEAQIARSETDLARIRDARDQLMAELSVRKADQEVRRTASAQAKELAEARDSRIAALEFEIERLKLELHQKEPLSSNGQLPDDLDAETLQLKLRTLENQYTLLSAELPSMEAAWKKAQALATKRIEEVTAWEEQLARLSAEKAKADQKYFAAMKAKDMREAECRALKAQNARSGEIVTQLKDVEAKTRELAGGLEKRAAELEEGVMKAEGKIRGLEGKVKEAGVVREGLEKRVGSLVELVEQRDKDVLAAGKAKREGDLEAERLKVRLDEARNLAEQLRKKKDGVGAAVTGEDWRKLAICPICNIEMRNTALRLCGHVFCSDCVKELISNRSRKCPNCGKGFGVSDQMSIVLT